MTIDVSAFPLHRIIARSSSTADGAPIGASSDIWATAVTNVAPLMVLVGERNAKEFLRVCLSFDQLLLIAVAPLGILSVMVYAILLSGYLLLRRVIGRDSNRRGEALVEITPLSVSPDSSVYTKHAVEIEPSEHGDRVAFVCAHIPHTTDVSTSLYAFKSLLMARGGKATFDKDYEIVLGLKGNTLSEDETAALIASLLDQRLDIDVSLADHIDSATLGFRMMGISPTQAIQNKDMSFQLRQVLNFAAFIGFFSLLSGLQIGGSYYGGAQYHLGTVVRLPSL